MIWTRVDRPARVMMEFATTESFADPVRLAPLNALPDSDLAVKRLLEGLPSDQEIFYRMVAADLADINLVSEPIIGRFRTAPASRRSVRFAWSGDTAGQGWGIDAVGMKTYAYDRRPPARLFPAFRRHGLRRRGDEGPRRAARRRPSGRNVVLIDAKRKVAETLPNSATSGNTTCWTSTCARSPRCADLLRLGRPRRGGQLVAVEGPARRRPLHREVGGTPRRPRRPRLPRDDPDPLPVRRARPGLPQDRLRPDARRLLPRPALLPRRRTARTWSPS